MVGGGPDAWWACVTSAVPGHGAAASAHPLHTVGRAAGFREGVGPADMREANELRAAQRQPAHGLVPAQFPSMDLAGGQPAPAVLLGGPLSGGGNGVSLAALHGTEHAARALVSVTSHRPPLGFRPDLVGRRVWSGGPHRRVPHKPLPHTGADCAVVGADQPCAGRRPWATASEWRAQCGSGDLTDPANPLNGRPDSHDAHVME